MGFAFCCLPNAIPGINRPLSITIFSQAVHSNEVLSARLDSTEGFLQPTITNNMSASWMPFLYQTRTLQRVWRLPTRLRATQIAHSSSSRNLPRGGYSRGGNLKGGPGSRNARLSKSERNAEVDEGSIPFDWGERGKPDLRTLSEEEDERAAEAARPQSTITPSEAYTFRDIFHEISAGKMPAPAKKKRDDQSLRGAQTTTESENPQTTADRYRSAVEQERIADFRANVLSRYPQDVREAAHMALGIYETKSGEETLDLQHETPEQREARQMTVQQREDERERIEALMNECKTDLQLWKVMEQEVFSLPEKLGILDDPEVAKKKKSKKAGRPKKLLKYETLMGRKPDEAEDASQSLTPGSERKVSMLVHGPLYTQLLHHGLKLFETSFSRPSPLAFQILPHIKSLGLSSYVLGVSSRLYHSVARMHWDHFGDATMAIEAIEDMNACGLWATGDVRELLQRIRREWRACASGLQGPLVATIADIPALDGALEERLDEVEMNLERPMSYLDEQMSV